MYTKVCSKMKKSVSSAFYMGTLKMQGDLRKHYAKHRKKGSAQQVKDDEMKRYLKIGITGAAILASGILCAFVLFKMPVIISVFPESKGKSKKIYLFYSNRNIIMRSNCGYMAHYHDDYSAGMGQCYEDYPDGAAETYCSK